MRFLSLTLAVILAFTTASHAQEKPLTPTQVEKIVADYIAANGDKVLGSIMAWQTAEKQKAIATAIQPFNPTQGPANAPVTIIEFSEFECPFCQKAQTNLAPVREKYKGKVRWVYKHYPLDFHPKAKPAAYASIAAHQQGKFWEYSEQLWAKQAFLSEQLYVQIAKDLKLDIKRFNADRANPALQEQVNQDMADGVKLGVQGTPFFLINGNVLSGAQPTEAFVNAIEAALKPANPAQK